ncbi:42463_t:CDS:2, partial [Gigaspora margarita]
MPPLRKMRPQTDEERRTTNVYQMRSLRHSQKNYNIGRCFQETTTSIRHISDIIRTCSYSYNSIFAFTSMGIKLDENLVN